MQIAPSELVANFHDVSPAALNHVDQLHWKRLEIFRVLLFDIRIVDEFGIVAMDSFPKRCSFLANANDTVSACVQPHNTEELIFIAGPVRVFFSLWFHFSRALAVAIRFFLCV